MKTKWILLLVLLLAVVLVFGACKKNPSNPQPGGDSGSQTPASDGGDEDEWDPYPDGLRFMDLSSGFAVYVEGQTCQEEELIIPTTSPDNKLVTRIGDFGFYGNTYLKKVVLPEGVTVIGGQAFAECTSLTSVELPNSLEQIKVWAFEHCTSLTEITYHGTISAWNGIIINAEWIDAGKTITIHCSNGDVTVTRPQTQSE